jgi:glycine oxidase
MRLIERGWEAIPSIYDLPIDSIDVGLRPGSRDNEPLIGPTGIGALYYATGHHRHGILLAPVTAYAISGMMLDGSAPDVVAPFHPSRFLKARGRR